jgi:hypothetical protein
MIKGSFTSATGVVTIAFDDGNVPVIDMDITQIGELSYNFDITPESVTIDRLLALYSNFRFSINSINALGDDVYNLITDALVDNGKSAVTLTVVTHEAESFDFKFVTDLNDISIDEASGVATILCKPFVSEDTFKTVFDAISSDKKLQYFKERLDGSAGIYNATGVASWIKQALPRLFGNNYPVEFASSKSNLNPNTYTEDIYADASDSTNDNKRMFALLDLGANFAPIQDETKVLPIAGTGFVGYADPQPTFGLDDIEADPRPIVNGSGTAFESLFDGQELFAFVGGVVVSLGIIDEIQSDTVLFLRPNGNELRYDNVTLGVSTLISPNQKPALDVLKELAGIEGSIFGSGFSRNFYINRLNDTQTPVSIDYDKVISASLKRTNLYLGTSIVSQLSSYNIQPEQSKRIKIAFFDRTYRFRADATEDPFGIYPAASPIVRPDNNQLPIMARQTSVSRGNPRASKELRIELAPAYPLLSKARLRPATPARSIARRFEGDISGLPSDNALESALTASGLRNYLRALNSVDGDFVVELQIKGAFSIKPYETFTLSNAPTRYQGKVYRVSQVSYDLVGDIIKLKGYKINAFDANIIPTSPPVPAISVSNSNIKLQWDTTKPSVGFFDVQATGISGSIEIACSAGFYSINTESTDNLWRNSIVLNTDGFGRVSKRIYVRFSPSASGIVSDSLLYGTVRVSGSGRTTNISLSADVIAPQQEFYIGQVNGIIGDDAVTEIPVNMFTEIERGREITLVGENKGNRYTFTVNQDIVPTGESNITVEEQFIEKDRYHIEASQNADRTGITVSEREIVLKVKSDGTIASIRLSADADDNTGSEINIVADQVKINNIRFKKSADDDEANGYIESTNFATGVSGWRIDGDGNAEFANVVARGRIEAEEGFLNNLSVDGTLTLNANGELTWDGGNVSSNGIVIDFELPSEPSPETSSKSLRFYKDDNKLSSIYSIIPNDNSKNDLYLRSSCTILPEGGGSPIVNPGNIILAPIAGTVIVGTPIHPDRLIISPSSTQAVSSTSGVVRVVGGIGVSQSSFFGDNLIVDGATDSTNVATGALRTSGGLGVAKNVWAGKQLNAGETFHLRGVQTFDDDFGTIASNVSYVRINDTSPSGFTYTLPSATGSGKLLTIKDVAGDAGSAPHTFNRAGSDTIDNDLSISLNTDFGRIILIDGASGRWDVLTKE